MDRKLFKSILLIITYAVVLVMALARLDVVSGGLWRLLGLFKPLFIGFGIAFVLNRPCHFSAACMAAASAGPGRPDGAPPGGGHLLSGAGDRHQRHLLFRGAQAGTEHPDLRGQLERVPQQSANLDQRAFGLPQAGHPWTCPV